MEDFPKNLHDYAWLCHYSATGSVDTTSVIESLWIEPELNKANTFKSRAGQKWLNWPDSYSIFLSKITLKPDLNQTQTRTKPDSNQTQIRLKPDSNQAHARPKPEPNQTQTRLKPGSNQIRLKPELNQT